MKWLIGLLTAATGILHLLVGFNVVGGTGSTNWILVLNGVGYLVLLWLFWTSSGSRRGTIRWILLAYTLITLVGYFVLNAMNGMDSFANTIGLVIKAIELLLVILLFLDRGSDRVVATAPAPAAARTGAVVSSEAYQAASGVGAASSAAAIGAATAIDRAETTVDAGMTRTADVPVWSGPASDVNLGVGGPAAALDADYVADYEVVDAEVSEDVVEDEGVVEEDGWVDRTGDELADAGDRIGDAAAGAWAATGAAVAGAATWLGDKAEDAADATNEALDTADDNIGGAVDATDDAITGAGASLAAGASAEWVGDTGDAYVGADRSVAAGGAAEWVGDTPDTTGALPAGAGMAAGAAAEWVGDTGDSLVGAESSVAAGASAEWVGDVPGEAVVSAEPTSAQLRSELEEYLRSFGSGSEFRKGVEYIEGVGPAKGAKLRDAGIVTVLDLMVEGATRRGRKNISDRTGLTVSEVLTWVNHIDLFRIKGVAEEYADLLEQSGVDTVVELAQRNANNLFKRMNDVNEQKKLVRRTPHLSDVQSWVEQAKSLKRLVHY